MKKYAMSSEAGLPSPTGTLGRRIKRRGIVAMTGSFASPAGGSGALPPVHYLQSAGPRAEAMQYAARVHDFLHQEKAPGVSGPGYMPGPVDPGFYDPDEGTAFGDDVFDPRDHEPTRQVQPVPSPEGGPPLVVFEQPEGTQTTEIATGRPLGASPLIGAREPFDAPIGDDERVSYEPYGAKYENQGGWADGRRVPPSPPGLPPASRDHSWQNADPTPQPVRLPGETEEEALERRRQLREQAPIERTWGTPTNNRPGGSLPSWYYGLPGV